MSYSLNYNLPVIEKNQFLIDPFSCKYVNNFQIVEINEQDVKKNKENEVFENGYSTKWKEVAVNTNPVFHTIPIYPLKNRNIVVGRSLQLDKCDDSEIVKLGCGRFFKLDLSIDHDLCKKFNNKAIYLMSYKSKKWLSTNHAKAGISFRTPVEIEIDVQYYFKIVGDNSDLYSVNIEIANLKV